MGYSYEAYGSQRLCCDSCGQPGGVRKRKCPYKVLGDSVRGLRYALPYCYPPALCVTCYAKHGGLRGLHDQRCADGAAASQAKYDAVEAALDAGESFVVAAYGSWAEGVPKGQTKVLFKGRSGETELLVPKDEYNPGTKPRLSQYVS